jgi:hypothetical protein
MRLPEGDDDAVSAVSPAKAPKAALNDDSSAVAECGVRGPSSWKQAVAVWVLVLVVLLRPGLVVLLTVILASAARSLPANCVLQTAMLRHAGEGQRTLEILSSLSTRRHGYASAKRFK